MLLRDSEVSGGGGAANNNLQFQTKATNFSSMPSKNAFVNSREEAASDTVVACNLLSESESMRRLTQNYDYRDSDDIYTPLSSVLGSAMKFLPKTAQVLDRGSQVT